MYKDISRSRFLFSQGFPIRPECLLDRHAYIIILLTSSYFGIIRPYFVISEYAYQFAQEKVYFSSAQASAY